LYVIGAVYSTISSLAKLLEEVVRTSLTSGRTYGTSCRKKMPARERLRFALHVDSFDADSVRMQHMPWLLDPFFFLQDCSLPRRDAVSTVIAAFVVLVGPSVPDDALPAGSCVLASGLACHSFLRDTLLPALALPPFLLLLGVTSLRSIPLGVLRPKPRRGKVWFFPLPTPPFLGSCLK
jgi:hypothetical protein